jgi:hypothetical protein
MEFWMWSWLLTAVGVTGLWLAPRYWWGWAINLAGQALWLVYALVTGQYGFLIATFAYGFVFAHNLRRAWQARTIVEQPKIEPRVAPHPSGTLSVDNLRPTTVWSMYHPVEDRMLVEATGSGYVSVGTQFPLPTRFANGSPISRDVLPKGRTEMVVTALMECTEEPSGWRWEAVDLQTQTRRTPGRLVKDA